MAKAQQPKAEQASPEAVVNQLGDVTERDMVVGPLSGDLIPVRPLAELPESHKHMAAIYPGAKGFTEEGSTIALHF